MVTPPPNRSIMVVTSDSCSGSCDNTDVSGLHNIREGYRHAEMIRAAIRPHQQQALSCAFFSNGLHLQDTLSLNEKACIPFI
jgi:hypothetical protein